MDSFPTWFFDYDQDGWLDLFVGDYATDFVGAWVAPTVADYLGQPVEGGTSRLYRNRGDGTFADVSAEVGLERPLLAMGANFGDVDNDGWPDLYVTHWNSANRLLRNRGDGTFEDITEVAGVGEKRWSIATVFFDYDRDGWLDLYVGNYLDFTFAVHRQCANEIGLADYCGPVSFKSVTDTLYRNRGDGTFEDVSSGSGAEDQGYGMGVAAGDVNNDGLTDLYITNVGPNVLLLNRGDGQFEDVTEAAGVGDPGWGTSTSFLDYDLDGDLDLFIVNYIYWSPEDEVLCQGPPHGPTYCSPLSYDAPAPDTLYRNEGDGTFVDVSADMGLRGAFGNGLGIAVSDFNQDGWPDVFVANDGMLDNLWLNQAGSSFEEVAVRHGCAVDQDGRAKAGMGVSVADVDNDGDEDLLVVNLDGESDSFYRTEGTHFSDKTPLIGLALASRPFTRFGVTLADFDDDGWLDLYQANGRVVHPKSQTFPNADPFAEPNLLYRGGERRFSEITPRGGTADPLVHTSRGAAVGDLDGDGALDLVVTNRDAPVYYLRNTAPDRGSSIAFRALTSEGRDELGATLSLRLGEREITRTVRSSYSYLTANSPRVHFGLGAHAGVDEVRVRWIDGSEEIFGPFTVADDGPLVLLRRGAGQTNGR